MNMQNLSGKVDGEEIDLQKIFFIFWRRKFLIALTSILFLVAGGYYAYRVAVPIYRASSVTMMNAQTEQVIDLPSILGQIGTDDTALQTEIEVIRSRILIGKVVDRLKLMDDPEFNPTLTPPSAMSRIKSYIKSAVPGFEPEEKAAIAPDKLKDVVVSRLLQSFSANVVPKTLTFRITVSSEDPAKAALIADTIADQYVQRQLDLKRGATVDAIDWLSDRVAELKINLQKSENAVKQFRTDTPLTNPEVLGGLERQLKSIRDRVNETERKITSTDEVLSALDAASGYAAKASLLGDPTLIRLATTADTNAADARRFRNRLEELVDDRRQDAAQARVQLATLQSAEESLETKVQTESSSYLELEQLTREAEANRTLYEYFLTRLKETSAQQGVQQSDSIILSYAVVPDAPSEPHTKQILLFSGLLGFLFGCGLSLLLEMRSKTFRSTQELEELSGISVVGALPLVPSKHRAELVDYLRTHPTSPLSEAIRNLRTSVVLSDLESPPQVVLMTSSIPGEGKTTCSVGLALNFVGMGKKVLLIEGDLRRLTFGNYFERPVHGKGLISLLAGERTLEETVVSDGNSGLDVIFGERSARNAADVLSSRQMKDLLSYARTQYDFIIIDAPPVLIVPDARVLSQFVDGILFVVKWDSTHQQQVEEALRLFDKDKIEGLVLNQIDPNGFKRYGYSYGAGYGYAAHYGDKYYDQSGD
ncbi:GumC family protein [Martelella limonii]|uniref:GumC family protein n=1 Tax=Martelella limonii TaxID=1647649 RepID=UPI00157FD1F6|nr:polysaccharide biosynthesis tyrosine autokinase [Martelella limonii]